MRDVVDENDEVVGQADKYVIERFGLNCRVAFVMLMRSDGELLLHQRSANKRAYPLYWSGAAAGHVDAGESYEDAANRELREELGIEADLDFVGRFYSKEDREMVGVFVGRYDGDVDVEPQEVAAVEHFSIEAVEQRPESMMVTSFVERSIPLVADWASSRS